MRSHGRASALAQETKPHSTIWSPSLESAANIDYVEAQDDYVSFRCGGKNYLKQQRLNELERLLDPARFIRVHRSYIVNVERLARLELRAKHSRVAILADGTELPVSRAGYTRLKPLL